MDRLVSTVRIGERAVGPGEPCFVVAEAGVNHNGSLETALALVDAAAEAGADAVKFQTFRAERVASREAPKAGYQLATTDPAEAQVEMLRRLELPAEAHAPVARRCRERGVTFLSSPFDEDSADLLERLGVPAFKVGSGELTNLPLLEHIARKGLPLILSTGMADLEEVREAVEAVRHAGCSQIVLLHCVSSYPADPADANLRAMATLASAFGTPVGFSDHTPGIAVSLGATALGASVIEKHLTLSRNLPGPDHRASLEPVEFRALVSGIRTVEKALGRGAKEPAAAEMENRRIVRRSLAAALEIAAGETLTRGMITTLRPATGIAPKEWPDVVGRRAKRAIAVGALISRDDLE